MRETDVYGMPSLLDRDFIECGLPSRLESMTSSAISTSAIVPCRPVGIETLFRDRRSQLRNRRHDFPAHSHSDTARRPQCIRAFGSVSTPHCSVRETQTSTGNTALAVTARQVRSVVELDVCLKPI